METHGHNEQRAVDARLSIPLFFRRYYIVVLFGADQRAAVGAEGKGRARSNLKSLLIASGLLLWLTLATLIALAVAAYLAKTWAGIDLIRGSSPVPDLMRAIRLCH